MLLVWFRKMGCTSGPVASGGFGKSGPPQADRTATAELPVSPCFGGRLSPKRKTRHFATAVVTRPRGTSQQRVMVRCRPHDKRSWSNAKSSPIPEAGQNPMTTRSLCKLAILAVLAASTCGCRGWRHRHDDCDECHYGCCDGMCGDDCSCGCGMGGGMGGGMIGGMPYGSGCTGGGCASCGQAPNLMPVGPQMYEQIPGQAIGPGQTYQAQPMVPIAPRTPIRPGPVE